MLQIYHAYQNAVVNRAYIPFIISLCRIRPLNDDGSPQGNQLLQDMGFANGQRIKRKADGLVVEIKEVGVTTITCQTDDGPDLFSIPFSSLQQKEWKVEKNKPPPELAEAKDLEKWKQQCTHSVLKASLLVKLWEKAPDDVWSNLKVFAQPKMVHAQSDFNVGALEFVALTNRIELKEVDTEVKGGLEVGKAFGGSFAAFLMQPSCMLPFWFMQRSYKREECNMELHLGNCSKQKLDNLTHVKFPSAKNFKKVKADDPLVLHIPEKKVEPMPLEPVLKRHKGKK